MIHVSEWYVFSKEGSSLRQRALYSEDCNRLQQTATERRLIFASKSLVFRRLQQTATDWSRLQQKEPYFSSDDQATSLCPISLSAYLSIHASIYVYVSVLCAYVCIDVFTRLCIFVCIYVSKHLFIYLSVCTCILSCRHTD